MRRLCPCILAGSGPFTIWDKEGFAAHWRKLEGHKPFFGLINFVETHESGIFPRPAWPRSVPHAYMQVIHLFLHLGNRTVVSPEDVTLPPYYPDTPRVRADIARHYNNVNLMDERVGKILDQLEADRPRGALEGWLAVRYGWAESRTVHTRAKYPD